MTDIDSNTLCNAHDPSPSTGLDRRAHLVFGDQHELRLFSKMYCAYYCKTRRMQGLTSACVCGQISHVRFLKLDLLGRACRDPTGNLSPCCT